MAQDRILVIKLGALGDFALSIVAMQAIRRHHPEATLVLLTRPRCRELADAIALFDEIVEDPRPGFTDLVKLIRLRRALLDPPFDRVYDLQRSDRSGGYFRLLWPRRPDWVGTVRGAAYRYRKPRDRILHIVERERRQLALAGVEVGRPPDLTMPDLTMIREDVAVEDLGAAPFLLVPGSSLKKPEKRWPAAHYAGLAEGLLERGYTPVLTGGPEERGVVGDIARAVPGSIDLSGVCPFLSLVGLARRSVGAVGNDTGPTHMIALSGCPTLTLFSAATEPRATGPWGENTGFLQGDPIGRITPEEVLAAIRVRPDAIPNPDATPKTDSA